MDFLPALGVAIQSETAVMAALRSGYTQQDLARESGVSVRTLRRIEKGEAAAATYGQIEAIADALGIGLLGLHRRAEQIMGRTADHYSQANSGGQNLIVAGQATIEGDINVDGDAKGSGK